MKRLLNRNAQQHRRSDSRDAQHSKQASARDARKFARSTADLHDRDKHGDYFDGRKSSTHGRKSLNVDRHDAYLSASSEDRPNGFKSLGRKLFKGSADQSGQGASPYSWLSPGGGGARQGSYSSASTIHSSPPHTPTTPHASADGLGSNSKDAPYINGLPQLPPLSSLGGDAGKNFSAPGLSQLPTSTGLATSIHASHLTSSGTSASLAPKKPLTIAVPLPARTSSALQDTGARVTAAPLSPVSPHSVAVPSPLATSFRSSDAGPNVSPKKEPARPASNLPTSSSFDETSDFLAAVLSFSDGGIGSSLSDDAAATTRPSAEPSSTFGTSSSSSLTALPRSPLGALDSTSRGLPRRLTEAQLAEIEQEERTKKASTPSYTYGRSGIGARPGLFSATNRKRDESDSEDEYGDADPADLEEDDDWEAARKGTTSKPVEADKPASTQKSKPVLQVEVPNKLMPGKKSSDFMSRASAFLKPRTSGSTLTPPPQASPPSSKRNSDEDTPQSPAFPSSFARKQKTSPLPSPKPAADAPSRAPQAQPLPGLNSPAKRALYACTLLKVHPQLDSILKVGVSNAVEAGEVPGSVEIRFPRSINTSKKLTAASKFGGSQIGVAGAPITLGSRRLDVALAQTKVMRKLRRRLTREDEVEIGWFLKSYMSETISPDTIAKSLAAKPQVSPEALAQPLVSSQEGEKTPLREATTDGRSSPDSMSPTAPGAAKDAARKTAPAASNEPNGLVRWVMRKPFLERCAVIRGETEETFNVGDIVVDAESAATAIPGVSASTFQAGDSARSKALGRTPPPKVVARHGDLTMSPRIRVLAGLPPTAHESTPRPLATREQKASTKRAPPPWSARRQMSLEQEASAPVPIDTRNQRQAAQVQAAHDKLVGNAVRSSHLLSPAQALAASTRSSMQFRRGSSTSITPPTGASPLHSPAVFANGCEGDNESSEASGGEFYSTAESGDDDDMPISSLALRRRASALSTNEGEGASTLRAASSSTTVADRSPDSRRTVSPRPAEEQERIFALEQELLALKKRERHRESLLGLERARLAKIWADQEAARKLEENKRQLKEARERRSRTEHSEVLTSATYGAGSSEAWYEQSAASRRLRQSASMADVSKPQLGEAFVHSPSQGALAIPPSSSSRGPLTPPLGSVPEQPRRSTLSPPPGPGRGERSGARQSTGPSAPPLSASARSSAVLGGAASPRSKTTSAFPPTSDKSARRLSSSSNASRQPEVTRTTSHSNLRPPSRGPGDASAHSQQKRLSSRPSLSAIQPSASSYTLSTTPIPPQADLRRSSAMYGNPFGTVSETNLGPTMPMDHMQQQQQQWQQFQQWQQMQYAMQQQQQGYSHHHIGGLAVPYSASFGGNVRQPLVQLGAGDIPSSASSARWREV